MDILKTIPFLVLLGLMGSCNSQEKASTQPPNIVFVFADDMTYTAVNALGNKEIQTPTLDRLVAEGTSFTHTYNMGAWNGAVCQASRAMLMTGRSIWNANTFKNNWHKGEATEQSWGQLLRSQGYDTYMTGKWDIPGKAENIFEYTQRVRYGGMALGTWNHQETPGKIKEALAEERPLKPVMPLGYFRPVNEQDTAWSPSDRKQGGFWAGEKHWSEELKDDALDFIAAAKERKKPFFMYLSFNAPHDPRQSPQAYIDRYPLDKISLPKSWLPAYPYREGMGCSISLRDEALLPLPRTPYAIKKNLQEYYAMITHMDEQIGGIIDGLRQAGLMENTYVVFTADHGLAMGRHGLAGKQSMFDHSMRAPFIVVGPDVPKGQKVAADIYLQDAMATTLDWAGVEKPDYIDFNSLTGLISGQQKQSNYPAIYGAYINWQRMIRKDGFKLIAYPNINKVLLYDMDNDPEEMHDLAQNPQYTDKVKQLFTEMQRLQVTYNDTLDLSPLQNTLGL